MHSTSETLPHPTRRGAPAVANPKRVLVVDDDPSVPQCTAHALGKHGYEVTACFDSTKVVDSLSRTPYGCVLLDLRIHGIEGTELLPIIKHRFPDLPVIIISAYVDPSNQNYCTSLGAFEVIQKPFNDDLLVDVVNRAMGATETIPIVLESLSFNEARDRVYRKLIITALRRANWNQVQAAKLLGVSRYCLIRWLHRLQITY